MPYLTTKPLQELYKTSLLREGILNWYPFDKNAAVLEKSGGALTDLLTRRCANLTSFADTYTGEYTFDYVVVLDPPTQPDGTTLELLKQFYAYLNPCGRLLMAFENPYSLRYFSGKRNQRTGMPFQFLFGESKKDVANKLRQVGFKAQKWYYPVGDHWFCNDIYSEAYLPNEFFNMREPPYIEDDCTKLFDEYWIWKEAIRNGAFEFLCNAYLVEACVNENDEPCGIDFAAVTSNRATDKRFATALWNNGKAVKTPLHRDGEKSVKRIYDIHNELAALGVNVLPLEIKDGALVMERLDLPTLWDFWGRKLSAGKLTIDVLIRHYDKIRSQIYKSTAGGKCFIELVPANCFYNEDTDELTFFDQEFCWDKGEADIVLVRALYALIYSGQFARHPSINEWLSTLKERYGLTERFDKLAEIADKAACSEVFNIEERDILRQAGAQAAENTVKRVKNYIEGVDRMSKLEELRNVELEILEEFIHVCEREDLIWYAVCGTLLGAVREGGFLLWDDDIDIAMPAEDYKRLMLHKEWFDGDYFLQTPLDQGRHHTMQLYRNGTTAFSLPLFDCLKQSGHYGICIDILPFNEIGDSGYYNLQNQTVLKEYFEPAVKLKFERLEVNVPRAARKVLSMLYGYWSWPSGAEYISPHYWFYDTKRDYREYIKRYTGWTKDIETKKLYLFGAADSLRIWLKDFGYGGNVVCTFDNDKNKWGKEAFGVEVRCPADIPSLLDENSRLIVTSIWHREICAQLDEMGVMEYYVFLDGLFVKEFKGKEGR